VQQFFTNAEIPNVVLEQLIERIDRV